MRIDVHHHHHHLSPELVEMLQMLRGMRQDMTTLKDQVADLVADDEELANDVDQLLTILSGLRQTNADALQAQLNQMNLDEATQTQILAASDATVKTAIQKAVAAINPDHPAATTGGDQPAQVPDTTGTDTANDGAGNNSLQGGTGDDNLGGAGT